MGIERDSYLQDNIVCGTKQNRMNEFPGLEIESEIRLSGLGEIDKLKQAMIKVLDEQAGTTYRLMKGGYIISETYQYRYSAGEGNVFTLSVRLRDGYCTVKQKGDSKNYGDVVVRGEHEKYVDTVPVHDIELRNSFNTIALNQCTQLGLSDKDPELEKAIYKKKHKLKLIQLDTQRVYTVALVEKRPVGAETKFEISVEYVGTLNDGSQKSVGSIDDVVADVDHIRSLLGTCLAGYRQTK